MLSNLNATLPRWWAGARRVDVVDVVQRAATDV